MRYFKFLFIILSLTIWYSCQLGEAEIIPNKLTENYFPLDSGFYQVYQVEAIRYTLDTVLKNKYYLKEVVGPKFNLNGREYIQLYRYRAIALGNTWELDSIWTVHKVNQTIVKSENDFSFVKLVFPIQKNSTWNGNLYNNLDQENYVYAAIFNQINIDNHTYDSSVTVIQHEVDPDNLLEIDSRYEVYAPNIGLIYKYYEVTETQPGEPKVGFSYIQKVISYGF